MAAGVQEMVRHSLDAFFRSNSHLARQVCLADADVDALDHAIIQDLLQEMCGAPEAIVPGQSQINIVRNLERVGDHATNIAEQVIYMVEGRKHPPPLPGVEPDSGGPAPGRPTRRRPGPAELQAFPRKAKIPYIP